ncbi:hypothetical protein IB275_30360 [Pseudomonas sp. PDM21]|uniref:hypothetical protein n=1 Tax=Pseudomonas sp. PDM21 TaxID=2769257 RepID=UPI001785CD83|nr:hypothetical protein [Pseudomonas sp. PDM21]MBD9674919.1 hypothetical protein [Pseudomonas sp. PDM21]
MPERDVYIERALNNPENRFIRWKQLDDGTYVALTDLMFTRALCIGVDAMSPYERRFCFSDKAKADEAFEQITAPDFEPDGWTARRPVQPEDYEPGGIYGYPPKD